MIYAGIDERNTRHILRTSYDTVTTLGNRGVCREVGQMAVRQRASRLGLIGSHFSAASTGRVVIPFDLAGMPEIAT
jgi:hypothetical protein